MSARMAREGELAKDGEARSDGKVWSDYFMRWVDPTGPGQSNGQSNQGGGLTSQHYQNAFGQAIPADGQKSGVLQIPSAVNPEPIFAPDQHELRQLLAIKLRSLAADLELGQFEKKYPNAGQVRQRVARLGDIAGALE